MMSTYTVDCGTNCESQCCNTFFLINLSEERIMSVTQLRPLQPLQLMRPIRFKFGGSQSKIHLHGGFEFGFGILVDIHLR